MASAATASVENTAGTPAPILEYSRVTAVQANRQDSDAVRTEYNPREIFKMHECTKKEGTIPTIYYPKFEVTFEDADAKIKKVEIGNRNRGQEEKTIIVLGATGSGKTTFINGVFNYILGTEWKDDFRYRLIQEIEEPNQARSQTQWITAYTIHHQPWFNVPYTITIIDTPGFGDASGIERDKRITDQIREFFSTRGSKGIDQIDAVGFVAQSSQARLTPTQEYIFESILTLFGNNIAENIINLLTFADGQKPQVLAALQEANCPSRKYFKFNNSALFVSSEESSNKERNMFDEMFWKMGTNSFRDFMTELSHMESKTLALTKEVLDERRYLEVIMVSIQRNIRIMLTKLEQLRAERHVLRQHQEDIDESKEISFEVPEVILEEKPAAPGQSTTTCVQCRWTCHENCTIKSDKCKFMCSAIKGFSNCRVCPCKGHWKVHKNVNKIYMVKEVQVSRYIKRYQEEMESKKLCAKQMIEKCELEIKNVEDETIKQIVRAKKCLARLEKIALRPWAMSTSDYIELLIQKEQNKPTEGWKKRVEQLIDLKEKCLYQKEIIKAASSDEDDDLCIEDVETPDRLVEILKKSSRVSTLESQDSTSD